jgi:DNA-binding NarL/FixJ family response regulator
MALILFVECKPAFLQAASFLMDRETDLTAVSQAASVAEGRERMTQGGVDAAIVSVPLPDEGCSAEFVGELNTANPSVPVLVLSSTDEQEEREGYLEAGASEVLSKERSFAEVLAAVRRLGA